MLRSLTRSAAVMTFLLGAAVIPLESGQEVLGTPRITVEPDFAIRPEVTITPLEYDPVASACSAARPAAVAIPQAETDMVFSPDVTAVDEGGTGEAPALVDLPIIPPEPTATPELPAPPSVVAPPEASRVPASAGAGVT